MTKKQADRPNLTRSGRPHSGSDHSAPHPVSRLAPAFDIVDLAAEIAQADAAIGQRVSSKLQVIADQVRYLQAQARTILEAARQDSLLHQARCAFRRQPGKTYHLYRRTDGTQEFSMLSPADWGGSPPHRFLGSYRLENDMSWTAAEKVVEKDQSKAIVERLLEARPED